MTAGDFIANLEKQGLLPDKVIGALRRMVEDAPKAPSPEELAKLLIERGQLTPFQAKKLLDVPTTHHAPPAMDKVPVAKVAGPKPASAAAPALQPLDDLGLAPLDGELPALAPLSDGLMPLDDAPAAKPATAQPSKPAQQKPAPAAQQKPAAKSAPAQQKPAAKPSAPAQQQPAATKQADTGLAPLSPLDEALPPLTSAGPAAAGGTADLLSDPLLSQADTLGGGSVLLPAKPKTFWESLFSGGGGAAAGGTARPASPWESPLILFGGGGLLLLAIIAVALFFALSSGNVQQAWDLAEKDYQEGAYASAIEKYEKFAASFSSDKRASMAKVKKAVAQLRIKTTAQDWPGALAIAQETLPEAEKEDAFGEGARPELVTLLPDILTGLIEKAKGTTDQEAGEKLLSQAKSAQELVDNPAYLPTTARAELEVRLGKLKDQVVELELAFSQDKKLGEALAKIKAAAEAGKAADAYQARKELIALYPALDRNAELRAALALAAQKDREQVKVTEGGPMAGAPTPAAPLGETILVAARTGSGVEGGPGGVLPVLAAGSIFGVDLVKGEALWRRPVGASVLTSPIRLAQGEEDVLFFDGNLKALVRASGRTGQAKWQLAVPEEPFAPLVEGGRALVAFRGGELWQVNLADGGVVRQVKFPIPLAAGPAVEAGKFLVIAGEHTNLFVLDPESLACRAVTYFGHSPGSISVPAAAILGHVLLATNTGGDVSIIHTFAISSETSQLAAVGEPLRLTGRVRTAPVAARARAVFTTDREEAVVLEVNPTDAKKPVTAVARAAARGRESVLTWPWFDGTQLWIAGRGVARFELQASRGQLGRLVETDPGSWLDAPLERIGDVLYSVRRREGVPGWVVAATRVSNPANPRTETQHVWELALGVPAVGAPAFDAAKRAILHATAAGDVFEISAADVKAGRAAPPAARLPTAQPPLALGAEVALASGERLYWSPGRSGVLWQRVEGDAELKPRMLPTAGAQTKAPPGIVGDIAVFGLVSGPVVGFKPGAAEPALTYQPPLGPGESLAWKTPAAVRAEPPELVAADDRGRLLLLAQADAASIYLAAKAQIQIDGELLAPPACLSGVVVAVVRKEGKDATVVYRLPQLAAGPRHELSGSWQFGPVAVGDAVYVATDRALLCLTDTGEARWKIDLAHGPLAGPPAADGTDLVIAYAAGQLARLKSADGSAAGAELDLGEPLRGAATTVGKRVLVGTPDGSLRFVPWPE